MLRSRCGWRGVSWWPGEKRGRVEKGGERREGGGRGRGEEGGERREGGERSRSMGQEVGGCSGKRR